MKEFSGGISNPNFNFKQEEISTKSTEIKFLNEFSPEEQDPIPNSNLEYNNINNTLEEIAKAGRSLKNLTDYLERHPEAIIQGKEK